MQKRIWRMSVFQNAKLMAVIYLILSIPMVAIFGLVAAFSGEATPVSGLAMLLMPLGYAVGGFIFSAIALAIYNLAARLVCGFEYTSVDAPAH